MRGRVSRTIPSLPQAAPRRLRRCDLRRGAILEPLDPRDRRRLRQPTQSIGRPSAAPGKWRDGGVLGPGGLRPFSIVNEPAPACPEPKPGQGKVKQLQLYYGFREKTPRGRPSTDSVWFTAEAASLFTGLPGLSTGSLRSEDEALYSPPGGLISNLEASGFDSGIQWFRDWNPLSSGQNLSFRAQNPVDSALETTGSKPESTGFGSRIQWIGS